MESNKEGKFNKKRMQQSAERSKTGKSLHVFMF